ncbi:ATP-dependent DNA helicase RecG [Anaplasma phagocytophilum]|uniref:Probable DNA 3'-5' helicase RecG n=3 Tax=Anaplasma phagocytophilum TaxID=948 RepID=A0AA45UT49_ANAPH|nr:ATP-dependent DNA helicase RecG [Anaplasma phagocytophilum]KJV63727.1 helicase domain protein [Anaplasma phagocytophilum str. ApMUC09]KJV67623.1 helicase domain protein [Anaplasma phagocytophilum str. ApNP]SBO14346.1 ATP-dependent DNA helicase RecG [Anaplasma phagocytophilum]SBO31583.1 ATP-dependent DNA helicase RecG [Anaplasma phagocytophilum]SBO31659.1 ATP-dependent DNA helicase RecG [Anaplasma phagocytophilum]
MAIIHNSSSSPSNRVGKTAKLPEVPGMFSSIYDIQGVDNEKGLLLEKLCGGSRIVDLLLYAPYSYVDRRNSQLTPLSRRGSVVTFLGVAKKHVPPYKRRKSSKSPYKVQLGTEIGDIWLIFFNYSQPYLESVLEVGKQCLVSGKLEIHCGEMQITHPDYCTNNLKKFTEICALEPVYSVTKGLHSRVIHKFIKVALKSIQAQHEWLPADLIAENSWLSWQESVYKMHTPENVEEVRRIKGRLAYDELMAYHAAVYFARQHGRRKGVALEVKGTNYQEVLKRLGFELTAGQKSAIREITRAQTSDQQMAKLLQGDVGSGKTVVALFAMLNTVESSGQVAVMVPTEMLAEQHCSWIKKLLEGMDICIELLTGKTKNKNTIHARLLSGEIHILIGTHALFQESVKFHNLRLVVIDEQQRFGVLQRMKLIEKGDSADILFITATPIPRTLEQILYGNMDRITLKDKPACRLPVKTSIVKVCMIDDLCKRLKNMISREHKIYWICPYIEGSEDNDVASVEERFEFLKNMFGNNIVGVSHGAMTQIGNESALQAFYAGNIKVLVATSIIEVGINVPDATIIVIENPERFGLSQLHQLRGRVGRGHQQSYCILLHGPVSKIAYRKLSVLRDSHDGFHIAEQDLILRGGGDMLGCRQSGIAAFKFADAQDFHAMVKAHAAVSDIVKNEDGRKLAYRLTQIFGHSLPHIKY